MKLYSIQPVEVAKLLKAGKTFICDPEKSGFSVELKEAYAWMVTQMGKRFPKPSNAVFLSGHGIHMTGNENLILKKVGLVFREQNMLVLN